MTYLYMQTEEYQSTWQSKAEEEGNRRDNQTTRRHGVKMQCKKRNKEKKGAAGDEEG